MKVHVSNDNDKDDDLFGDDSNSENGGNDDLLGEGAECTAVVDAADVDDLFSDEADATQP